MNFVYSYLRFSRDEADKPGLLDEKIERHKQTARDLAARYSLDLREDHIVVEVESGSKLRNRPKLLWLLDLAHAGLLTHLIAPAQDRIDRLQDKREQADLEDAMYAGEVTLITTEGVSRYNDELDTLPQEIRSLVARAELRNYRRRRREANRTRLANNQRTSSWAPWGYRRNRESESGYDIVPEEYAEVELAFSRLLSGWGINTIHRDLVERKVPTPGSTRLKNASGDWCRDSVYYILLNPFYAGYHARRTRALRDGSVRYLHPSEFEVAGGAEGRWPHPITLDQWRQLVARFPGGAYAQALLTGVLLCPEGNRIRAAGAGRSYGCVCPAGARHYTTRPKWEAFTENLILEFIARLPETMLKTATKPVDRSMLHQQLSRATANHRVKAGELQQFALEVASASSSLRYFKPELLQKMIAEMEAEEERAREEMERLQALAAEPDIHETMTLLNKVREAGGRQYWDALNNDEKRDLILCIVQAIQLDPVEGRNKHFKRGRIHWQQWVLDAGLSFEVPEDWWSVLKRPGHAPKHPIVRDEKGRITGKHPTTVLS